MAFTQFPNQQYFISVDTDTVTDIGNFNLSNGTELRHIMLTIFVNGVIPAAFDARLNIYGNSDFGSAIFSSEWAEISTTTLVPSYTTNWLGNVYFDFAGQPLNPNNVYYVGFETDGYTRNGDTYYVGVNLDWYSPVNTQLSATEAGARFRILGRR